MEQHSEREKSEGKAREEAGEDETRTRNWKGGKRGRGRSEGKERKENMHCDSLATGYIREKEDMATDVC